MRNDAFSIKSISKLSKNVWGVIWEYFIRALSLLFSFLITRIAIGSMNTLESSTYFLIVALITLVSTIDYGFARSILVHLPEIRQKWPGRRLIEIVFPYVVRFALIQTVVIPSLCLFLMKGRLLPNELSESWSFATIFSVGFLLFLCSISCLLCNLSRIYIDDFRFHLMLISQQVVPALFTLFYFQLYSSLTTLAIVYSLTLVFVNLSHILFSLPKINYAWRKSLLPFLQRQTPFNIRIRQFTLLQVLNVLATQIDILVLAYFLEPAEVVRYAAFTRLLYIPHVLYSSVFSTKVYSFSNLYAKSSVKEMDSALLSLYKSASLIITIFLLIYALFAEDIFVLLTSGEHQLNSIEIAIGAVLVIVLAIDAPLNLLRASVIPDINFILRATIGTIISLTSVIVITQYFTSFIVILAIRLLLILSLNSIPNYFFYRSWRRSKSR